MMRKILEKEKSQTRRLLKGSPPAFKAGDLAYTKEDFWFRDLCDDMKPSEVIAEWSAPDSILNYGNGSFHLECLPVSYDEVVDNEVLDMQLGRKRNAMFQPKLLSRCLLQVTSVRKESLQELTEDDAIKEGCKDIAEFKKVWGDLYQSDSMSGWNANPEVYVYEFEILKCSKYPLGLTVYS